MQPLEMIISEKVRGKVDNVFAAIEPKVHEAILSAINKFVVALMEISMTSVGISSAWKGYRWPLWADLAQMQIFVDLMRLAQMLPLRKVICR